jgi:hypothetical protein
MDLNICSVITIKFKILKFPNNIFTVIPGGKTPPNNSFHPTAYRLDYQRSSAHSHTSDWGVYNSPTPNSGAGIFLWSSEAVLIYAHGVTTENSLQ